MKLIIKNKFNLFIHCIINNKMGNKQGGTTTIVPSEKEESIIYIN